MAFPRTSGTEASNHASYGVFLYAEFTARAEHMDLVTELIAAYGIEVRMEPGNVRFEPYIRGENPAQFVVFEEYASKEAFREHLSAAKGAAFNERLRPLIEEPESVLHWLTPSPNPAP
ncbi:putative quinol monooxygenase [Arthrobacter sp. 92]|uniref:putative quinol monooxygenase n=1 Tax=Arthrobacter sp. 92 TaxID=3418175 RepID=UPI003CFF7C6E